MATGLGGGDVGDVDAKVVGLPGAEGDVEVAGNGRRRKKSRARRKGKGRFLERKKSFGLSLMVLGVKRPLHGRIKIDVVVWS